MNLKNKRVLFIIADNFREEELFETKKILVGYNAKIDIASKELRTCKGVFGKIINPNISFDKINISDYDAIIFVGGPGSMNYWDDEKVLDIAKESYLKAKLTCAICLASGILAIANIIKDRKVTGWQDTKELIEKNKGIYTGNGIEVDRHLITAQGPKYAREFGETIAKYLNNKITI